MKKALIALGILLGVCLLFFWPIFKGYIPFPGDLLIDTNPYRSLSISGYAPGAYPNKAQGQDVISEMFPWRYFTIQELKQGRIPLWNPHNFSGNIHMQNLQSSVFNPFNILFFLFPFTIGWTLFILVQPIVASLFFYLFAREIKISRFASICGAIGFAFSSYMTVWIEYGNIAATFAYLPLLFYFLLRFFHEQKRRYYIGFIISATFMMLSGYIQGAFYAYCMVGSFALLLGYIHRKIFLTWKNNISVVAMFIFPIFLSMFQLYSTYETFSQSSRWPYSLQQFQVMLQPIWYWITLFASDFFGNPATRNYYLQTTYIERVAYIGIPFLFFAFYALFQKRTYISFFACVAAIAIFFTTNFPIIGYFYLLPIPVIDTTVPTRFLSVFMFAGVVLASFGIDIYFRKKEFPKLFSGIFIVIYGLLWIGLFIAKRNFLQFATQIVVSEHNLILPTLFALITICVLLIAKKAPNIAKIMLFILIIGDLFYVFQKITPFAPIQTVYPKTPVMTYIQEHAGINRFWGYGSGYIQPNYQTIDGTYSPEGNDPLHSRTYGELLASSYNGKIPQFPPRPDANVAAGYGRGGMQNPFRQQLLNLLGVKYVIQHDEFVPTGNSDPTIFPEKTYSLVWSQNPWQIYQNNNVLPRYFLVNSYLVAQGQKSLNLFYTVNLSKTIILNHTIPQKFSPSARGTVRLLSYSSQYVSFATNTTGPMLLFLSDNYFPSWQAKVDLVSTPIYLADYTFRAVSIPKGQHIVVMSYGAKYFQKGALISAIAFVVLILSLFVLTYAKVKK